jgi:hypothetical protein
VALAVTPFCAIAQVEQRIVVSEYLGKDGKSPLPQVGVTVLNAGAALSDPNGEATLRFRTLHAGDRVTVRRIEKPGYEIFNTQAIEQWNISPQNQFQIILCQSAKLQALRDQYNRVARQSYAKQYNAEKAKLASERKKTKMLEETYAKKMQELENQYQQQLEDLENYVDQFARIDLSDLNAQQQKLIDLVRKGKIDEAIRQYEEANYPDQYQKQCEEISKIDRAQAQLMKVEAEKRSQREKLYQAIGRQIGTYRLAGGRENFQKVTDLMKTVADADTTQLDAVWDYAVHALKQGMLDESERYIGIFMRATADQPDKQALAYKMMGQAYMNAHELGSAETAYTTALAIREKLAQQDADRYTASMIESQLQLSTYYLWIGNVEASAKLLDSAIPMCETCMQDNANQQDDTYRLMLCPLYANQSLVHCYGGDSVKAIQIADKACEIGRAINDNDAQGDGCTMYIAALIRKQQACYMFGRWDEMANTAREFVDLCEPLYKQNPDAMAEYYHDAYNNLAEACIHIKDYTSAEKAFLKAEVQLEQLVKMHPTTKFYTQFTFYDTGAHLYDGMGNPTKRTHYVALARKAFNKMPAEEQQQYKDYMDALDAMK